MGKWVSTAVLDGAFDLIADSDLMTACAAQPTTYANATTTGPATGNFECARVTGGITTGAATGGTDYTLVTTGGNRKCTVAQQGTGNTSITASKTANHIALCDVSASSLLYVTTCTSQSLTTGNDVTFNSWSITLNEPI